MKSLSILKRRVLFDKTLQSRPINALKKLAILTHQALNFFHSARGDFASFLAVQSPGHYLRTRSIHMRSQNRCPSRVFEFGL
jgi:hypothetical protein